MKRRRSRRLLLPGAVAVAVYFAVAGGEHSVLDARRAEDELAARRADTRQVQREIDSLRARIADLRDDDEALERYARERYGFIRDGEYLYRISEPEAAPESEDDAPDRPALLGWLR